MCFYFIYSKMAGFLLLCEVVSARSVTKVECYERSDRIYGS